MCIISGASREFKGKSVLLSAKDFTAIDLETTGLSPEYDDIIEIGAVKYRDGVPVGRFEQLVSPGYSLPEYIVKLTGITDEMLADAPALSLVLPEFLSFVGNDLIVGHNVSFDVNFIYDNCVRCSLPAFSNDYLCTMRLSRRMFPEWKNHKLKTMVAELCPSAAPAHRAIADCEATANCYYAMMKDEQQFISAIASKHSTRPGTYQKLSAKDLTADTSNFDPSSVFYQKTCVFTGTLDKMQRKDAMQMVLNIGGFCGDSVTKKTNFLILGNNDYCSSIKDGKSSKQKKAEELILKGFDLEIIPENIFYELLELEQ